MATTENRWCFRYSTWQPSQEEWETALESIQEEESQRISRYPFKKDAKSSMVGRLMLRRAVHEQLDIPWADILFARTKQGKPYLTNEDSEKLSVNVSHHGDYTVLVSSNTCKIGVDVVKTERPKNGLPVESLFDLMRNQFTEHEWRTIYQHADEWDQLSQFYRIWSLKESYVKATGTGLNIDPQRLEFHVKSQLARRECTRSTTLYVDGKLQENWDFEETQLDSLHSVSIALYSPDKNTKIMSTESNKSGLFQKISKSHLLDCARPLGHEIPVNAFNTFQEHKESIDQC